MSKLSIQDKKDILQKYKSGKHSLVSISKIYNVSRATITDFLHNNGGKNKAVRGKFPKKYNFDEHYFDHIDSENKAYFLGFLYSDGYNNVERGIIELSLQEEDRCILEQFSNLLQNSKPLYFKDRQSKNQNHKNVYRLTLYSKYTSNRLKELGCGQGKTKTLDFPNCNQVPRHLMRHFLRGFWDGDGTIGFIKRKDTKNKTVSTRICGTHEFLYGLQLFLKEELGVLLPICDTKHCDFLKIMYVTSKINTYNLLCYLYKDSTVYLPRKYQKFLDIKDFLESQTKYSIFKDKINE